METLRVDEGPSPDAMLLAVVIAEIERAGSPMCADELVPRCGGTRRRVLRALRDGTAQGLLEVARTAGATRTRGTTPYSTTTAGRHWALATYAACGRAGTRQPAQRLASTLCEALRDEPFADDDRLMQLLVPIAGDCACEDVADEGADGGANGDDDVLHDRFLRTMFAALRSERPRALADATRAALDAGWIELRDGRRVLTTRGSDAAAQHSAAWR